MEELRQNSEMMWNSWKLQNSWNWKCSMWNVCVCVVWMLISTEQFGCMHAGTQISDWSWIAPKCKFTCFNSIHEFIHKDRSTQCLESKLLAIEPDSRVVVPTTDESPDSSLWGINGVGKAKHGPHQETTNLIQKEFSCNFQFFCLLCTLQWVWVNKFVKKQHAEENKLGDLLEFTPGSPDKFHDFIAQSLVHNWLKIHDSLTARKTLVAILLHVSKASEQKLSIRRHSNCLQNDFIN